MDEKESTTATVSLHLIGDIDSEKVAEIIDKIEIHKEQRNLGSIELLLSSAGGYLYPTFTLFDYLKSLKIPVQVTATGRCQSCALALLQAGTKRVSRPHTLFGLHANLFTIPEPKNLSDINAEMKEFEIQNDFFFEILSHHTSVRREELEKLSEREFLFPPQEALRLGLIDTIKNETA
jgi:ATP-dependent Clp protease, protease subunit